MSLFLLPDLQQLYFTEGDLIRKRFWFFISVRRCTSAGGHYADGIRSAINGFQLLLRSLLKQANCCLQPENLLLDSSGNLKISDFGLSALPQQVRVRLLPHFSLVCSLVTSTLLHETNSMQGSCGKFSRHHQFLVKECATSEFSTRIHHKSLNMYSENVLILIHCLTNVGLQFWYLVSIFYSCKTQKVNVYVE